jgi:site-specific recombinase XerD
LKPNYFLKMNDRYKKYLQSEGYSSSTIKYHLVCLARLKKWSEQEQLEMEQLGHNDLMAYVKWCYAQGAGKIGVSRYLVAIRTYFGYLVEKTLITENPASYIQLRGLPRKKLHDTFTPLELETLYHRYVTTPVKAFFPSWQESVTLEHERDKVMVGLFIYQGLTTGELLRLECRDIKLREGQIEIHGGRRSNGRMMNLEAAQVMDMHHYIKDVRMKIMEKSGRKSENLFITIGKNKAMYSAVEKVSKQLQKLEPRFKSFEQIRASVITKWIKLYNLRQVQQLAGHRYIGSTEKFLQNDMEGLTEEVNKFHPLG